MKIPLRPLEQRGEPACIDRWQRSRHELRLPTLAVRRHDETSGNLIRNRGSVVTPDDVQTEIDAGRTACGRQDSPFIDVQDVGFYLYSRETSGEPIGVPPMRCDSLAVE